MTSDRGPEDRGDQPDPYRAPPPPMPQAPPLNESEAGPIVRPKSVDTSFLLWLVAAGISLISNLLSFATSDEVAEETMRQLDVSFEQAEPGAGSSIFSIALLVAWVAVVFAMRSGQNWARIVLTVLGGIYVVLGLISLLALGILFAVGVLGALQGLLSIVAIVVTITAIVFQFKADANHYFKVS